MRKSELVVCVEGPITSPREKIEMRLLIQMTRLTKTLLLSSMVIFALHVSASAQEISEEHLKVAREAIKSIGSTRQLDNILPGMANTAKTGLIQNRPDQQAKITEIVDGAAIELAPRRGDLETEVARIYARIFTIDELQAIGAFYGSETGQKMLKQTPVFVREVDAAARVWSVGLQRDLQESISKKLTDAGLQ